jgi:Flp pilus assembly protein TadG
MRRITRTENGQAMVEFALVAPILFLILFGIVQFGIAFMNSVALTDAVRAGARKAAVSRTAANPTQSATNAVLGAANDLNPSKLSVTVTSDWQSGDNVTVTATYPYQINLLGIVVASGNLHSSTTERVE